MIRFSTPLMALALGCSSGFSLSSNPPAPADTIPKSTNINVQEIKATNGVTAWMVECRDVPVVSVSIAFKNAGYTADPKGLTGLVNLLTGMLDEGAGEWNSQEFKKFLLEKNIELTISANQDAFILNFRTIKQNIGEAFRVLHTILMAPRFEAEAFARVKNQIATSLAQSLHNERTIADQKVNSLIYGNHPYGKTITQTLKEFPHITVEQMRAFIAAHFARDNLLISVVGDITPNQAEEQIGKTFGDLPAKATGAKVKNVVLENLGTTNIENLNIPQSIVYFIQPGIMRKDPDFYTAFVLLKILGDGQFASRLWNEVREKRGLAYGIDATLNWMQHASLIVGATATKNENVQEVVDIVQKQWQLIKDKGATQSELDFVKQRMIGSFALNFSSTGKIAASLLAYQLDDLDINFINNRNKFIAAITLEQINKLAKSLLKPEELTFVIVGNPRAMTQRNGITPELSDTHSKTPLSNPKDS